jgi:hypothetical protein
MPIYILFIIDRQECGALANSEQIDISNSHPPPIPDLSFPRRSPALFKIPCGHLLVLGGCSGQHFRFTFVIHIFRTFPAFGQWRNSKILQNKG